MCIGITWGVLKTTDAWPHLQGFQLNWSGMLPCISYLAPVPTGWAFQPLPGDPGPWGPETPSPLSCSSEEAVDACCCYSLAFFSIPCWLLSSSKAPGTNSLHDIPSAVKSQSGSSFPCAGFYGTLTKTAGSEDREGELLTVWGSLKQPALVLAGRAEEVHQVEGECGKDAGMVAISRGHSFSRRDTCR